MSTHKVGFYKDLIKVIFQLSSNTHIISSSDYVNWFESSLVETPGSHGFFYVMSQSEDKYVTRFSETVYTIPYPASGKRGRPLLQPLPLEETEVLPRGHRACPGQVYHEDVHCR